MSATSKGGNTDLALVFGGGGRAAPAAAAMKPGMDDESAEPMADDESAEGEAPPPEFATHAEEALDPEAAPEDRIKALYRAIQACH